MDNGRSSLSKAVDFGTYQKRVCSFLLVINSNVGYILPHFKDIAGFVLKPPPHPNPCKIWGCSLGLDRRCWTSVHQRHGQTDKGRRDGQLTVAIPRSKNDGMTSQNCDALSDKNEKLGVCPQFLLEGTLDNLDSTILLQTKLHRVTRFRDGATEFAGQENAGLENDGQHCSGGK